MNAWNVDASNDLYRRFRAKVYVGPGCWTWGAALNNRGYPVINVGNQKLGYAHRLSVIFSGRDIPQGMEVDHLCRNPRCVRPDHLEVVTPRVNKLRSTSVSAINALKTRCSNGHEFSPKNTYIRKDTGNRQCKKCGQIRNTRKRTLRRQARIEPMDCGTCGSKFVGLTSPGRPRKFCSTKCSAKASMAAYKIRQAKLAGLGTPDQRGA